MLSHAMLKQHDLEIKTLGPCDYDSPLVAKGRTFADESIRVRVKRHIGDAPAETGDLCFEEAGPRRRIFFNPAETTAAFVTCGGLSPGLNNVIRSGFLELTHNYGVKRVVGIRNGYAGLNPDSGLEPIFMTQRSVQNIHHLGGTFLGSSRGMHEPAILVDFLEAREIDILFCIGGDGTQRGAHAIHREIEKRGLRKSIIGIPKTIDNDVPFVELSFGYVTALEVASEVLRGAHVEAVGAPNGVGLVKLMGRAAGFIAAGAAIASQEANFVLVPEVPFPLEGAGSFLEMLERRLLTRGHALIVVAEGAGQHLFEAGRGEHDASGNVRFRDIGAFLRLKIEEHFDQRQIPMNLKYIDPSYVIRSVPANAWDRILTDRMARGAVHAAMAGKTDAMMGYWNQEIVHVPIAASVSQEKRMSVESDLWNAVLATTGQPDWR
ncbi:MAG: ATP-dependent 6-phosphofructokinase [Deltaproteobacteria bacterium]|jgi:6-phosphofructokinase 1|nr:ATP-dependent 6-phosphofructokinase [Deltaproteobacteria bacterium]